ncbi:DUF4870 domain-containing protein [Hugenholtzia roseola]|uniref:DUF4870 domain-containing protein n=1 Tax=Hugenholtzia roseola TaxID=1002 RepID=UPI0003F64FA2|nr:hypothetical protein [Hugenholtzia roseola]
MSQLDNNINKPTTSDKGKNVAVISYITLVGWVVAYVMNQDEANRSSLSTFHLRQMAGIAILGIVGSLFNVIPFVGWIVGLVAALGTFVFWIMGLISAINGEEKPVPVVGELIQEKLADVIK